MFRVYRNTDLLGCELGGVLKNVIAIAQAWPTGSESGTNTRRWSSPSGLAEITRLGEALGANLARSRG